MRRCVRAISLLLAVGVALAVLPARGLGLAPAAAGLDAEAEALHQRMQRQLARADVRALLQRQGASAGQAAARVAALSDTEVAALDRRLDAMPAVNAIGALAFTFLVLLVADILGLTRRIPFTRPPR